MDKIHQMMLARDIIDMIREYKDDANALEYPEGIAVSLATLFESDHSGIDWYTIASICDQRYCSLKQGNPIGLDTKTLNSYYEISCKAIADAVNNLNTSGHDT